MSNYDSRVDTFEHIQNVQRWLWLVIENIGNRSLAHDASKLIPPELEAFDEYTPKLKDLVYGSEGYKASLAAMAPALEHHYAENPHHPEHFENGIRDMSLIDLIEMLVDWYAASQRTRDSDFERSIALNQERFRYGDELASILRNTARELGMVQ
jgi:Family of unknown function (DUF5662)